MKKWILRLFTGLAIATTTLVMAQNINDAVYAVKQSVGTLLADLKQNQSLYESNPEALSQMIDHEIAPHFDIAIMARYVLGRHWHKASNTERQDFIREFEQMTLRAYSSSLLDYINASVTYGKPDTIKKKRTKVRVTISANGNNYPLMLSMRYTKGKWLVYDVSLDGISIITTYRSSLNQEIEQKGLAAVIADIKAINANAKLQKKS